MKKTFISAVVATMLALPGISALAAGQAGVSSGSQIVLSAGVNGGSVVGGVYNQQTATLGASTSYGAGGTLLGQSAGSAGVSGSGSTSTTTIGGIVSTGAAGGTLAGGGNSTVTQSGSNQYATSNNVKGTVQGSLATQSASSIQAADNGAAAISASANGAYAATAQSSQTGIFTRNNQATTSAIGTANTSTPTTLNWGNVAFNLSNTSNVGAGSTSQAGTLTSSSAP